MKMGRRSGAAGSRIDLEMLLRTASPARTALPAAHFNRNATDFLSRLDRAAPNGKLL
jgi:hypothetical protein